MPCSCSDISADTRTGEPRVLSGVALAHFLPAMCLGCSFITNRGTINVQPRGQLLLTSDQCERRFDRFLHAESSLCCDRAHVRACRYHPGDA